MGLPLEAHFPLLLVVRCIQHLRPKNLALFPFFTSYHHENNSIKAFVCFAVPRCYKGKAIFSHDTDFLFKLLQKKVVARTRPYYL